MGISAILVTLTFSSLHSKHLAYAAQNISSICRDTILPLISSTTPSICSEQFFIAIKGTIIFRDMQIKSAHYGHHIQQPLGMYSEILTNSEGIPELLTICQAVAVYLYWLRKLLMSSLEKSPTTTTIVLSSFLIVPMMSSCGLRLFVKMNTLSSPEEWTVIRTS